METRIRRGGVQTAGGFLFEITGGDVALDFTNTVDMRPTDHPKELITTFRDLCSWARQAGILTEQQEKELLKKAARHPKKAENARRLAIALRECMFEIFNRITEEDAVPEETMKEWNRYVHRSLQHYELVRVKEGLSWKQDSDDLDFDSMVWPVIHSAVQLLTGSLAARIRKCASDKCDWLFLDTSKRGNRRWCDMTVCGNRAKAQRFYSRKKALQQ
jgi:predicted RNA-binding Zn ribbon-like protein